MEGVRGGETQEDKAEPRGDKADICATKYIQSVNVILQHTKVIYEFN